MHAAMESAVDDEQRALVAQAAERSVLAAMMLSPKAIDYAASRLADAHFATAPNRKLFSAIVGVHQRGERVDLVTVAAELESRGELDRIGGQPAVAQVTEFATTAANIAEHCRIVLEKAADRAALSNARALVAAMEAEPHRAVEVLAERLEALGTMRRAPSAALPFITAAELVVQEPERTAFIVPGLVAAGCITSLDAKPKVGKTTFLAAMVRAVTNGGAFLSRPVEQTRVVWLTEQTRQSMVPALRRSGLEENTNVVLLSWHETRGRTWESVAAEAIRKAHEFGAGLLLVDTLSKFAGLTGDAENSAGEAMKAMIPLERGAGEGLAIVAARHERKEGGEVGDSGRGSNAFTGACDVVISLRRGGRGTVRVIRTLSRFDETPPEMTIELVGGAYVAIHENVITDGARERIEQVVLSAPSPLSCGQTAQIVRLSESAVRAHLSALWKEGRVTRDGGGKATRYRAPAQSADSADSADETPQAGATPLNKAGI